MAHKRLFVVAGVAVLAILCLTLRGPARILYVHFFVWTEGNMERDMESANILIDALGRFKSAQGNYPASLDELTPGFVADLGAPIIGDVGWRYSRSGDGTGYMLQFGDMMASPTCWYSSAEGEWSCDDR